MVLLDMRTFTLNIAKDGFVRRRKTSIWRVGTVDGSNAVFPSDERIEELFRRTVRNAGKLVVAYNPNNANYFTAELPLGTEPKQRKPFLEALENETRFIG